MAESRRAKQTVWAVWRPLAIGLGIALAWVTVYVAWLSDDDPPPTITRQPVQVIEVYRPDDLRRAADALDALAQTRLTPQERQAVGSVADVLNRLADGTARVEGEHRPPTDAPQAPATTQPPGHHGQPPPTTDPPATTEPPTTVPPPTTVTADTIVRHIVANLLPYIPPLPPVTVPPAPTTTVA